MLDAELMYDGLNPYKEQPLDVIESPVYEQARLFVNSKISSVLKALKDKKSDSGAVTLKIAFNTYDNFVTDTEDKHKAQHYTEIAINFSTKATISQSVSDKGSVPTDSKQLLCHDDRYVIADKPSDQVTFEELNQISGQTKL